MLKTLKTLTLAFALIAIAAPAAHAWENKPSDDKVTMNLSAEDWVTTKTARVIVGVEAAVTAKTSGNMRKAMASNVDKIAKADWRLTNFYRTQDKTGMERWSASYEARLPESILSGLNEQAKKKSKAGMQLKIRNIDFAPTLDERQTVKSTLRTKIYKLANEQLKELNANMGDTKYRISMINFSRSNYAPRNNRRMMAKSMDSSGGAEMLMASPSMEKSEKMTVNANIVFASTPTQAIKTQ